MEITDFEDYVVAVPSGQVIDMLHSQISDLIRIGYVMTNYDKSYRYSCNDFTVKAIYNYLNKDQEMNEAQIIDFLMKQCELKRDHIKIWDDLSVDVYTSISLSHMRLFRIPIKFNRCTSNFDCSYNKLTTLENCPKIVHGNFNCSFNNLSNLVGGPKTVTKSYNCSYNKITNFEGAPAKLNIFNCSYNKLESLSGVPITTGAFISIGNPFHKN